MPTERKILECPFDVKEITETGQFRGHAAIFNNIDLQGDKIERGAFKETLAESGGRWPILFGHNTGRVVGFSTGGEEDSKGLRVTGEFTLASDEGRNAYAVVKHAAELEQKFGLSIGYQIRKNGADFDAETNIRTLKSLQVHEFSLTPIPANPRARVTMVKDCTNLREAERFLCGLGLTGNEAREFISLCKAERDAKPCDDGAERDAKPWDDGELERDAKESHRRAAEAFMAEMRQASLIHSMKGII